MKKLLLIAGLLSIAVFHENVQAQCTPNPVQNIFLIPDTATDFAPAFTYVPYSEVLYIKVPTDTTIYIFPVTLDSIVVTGISGLPASFSYNCSPVNCNFPAGQSGCIQISGTPTLAEIGNYPFTINANVSGTSGIIGDTTVAIPVTGYRIRVIDSAYMGTEEGLPVLGFDVKQNAPNPFCGVTSIEFSIPTAGQLLFEVRNIAGQLVHQSEFSAPRGINTITFESANHRGGMYFYTLKYGDRQISRKLTITSNP